MLPYNVSFHLSAQDYIWKREKNNACLGSSNEDANFTTINFLEIKRMIYNVHYRPSPWDRRHRIPIFRGTPWVPNHLYPRLNRSNETTIYQQVLNMSPRLKAVDYSLRHPRLLDARVHRKPNVNTENDAIWFANSSVGLHKLLSNDFINTTNYYQSYQTAIALCGIGAPFRTSIHLETSTPVVLQQCDKKEWFHDSVRTLHSTPPRSL